MQRPPSVKVTIVKKRRRNSQQSVKSERSGARVTGVKSVTSRSVDKVDKSLVVENVDTISTVQNEPSSLSLRTNIERRPTIVSVKRVSCSQPLKSITDKLPSGLMHPSKSHILIPIQPKDPFNLNSGNQLVDPSAMSFSKSKEAKINSSSLKSSADGRREIHTIGRDKTHRNKKSQLCQKCSLRHYVVFGLALTILIGVIIALPVVVVSLLMTTTTITSTSATTAAITSVTTATAAATVTITSNACTSSWMGITSLYHCDSCSEQLTYAPSAFNYLAIANVTRITFALRRDLGYFGIDDVSIHDVAAPTIELLLMVASKMSGSLATGSVQSTSSGISCNGYTFAARSGIYYYLGGATVHTEYLSEIFPSVIGHKYIFSFAYVYAGNGSLNSGDFLLSI